MFRKVFPSKQDREFRRNMAIKRAVKEHGKHITKLEQHEREYMEKAVRARKSGDKANLSLLCRMIAQTANQRKAIQSQLLHLEIMIQTRDRMSLTNDFRSATVALSRSVAEMFRDFNAQELIKSVDSTLHQTEQVTEAMDLVLDRIATNGLSEATGPERVSSTDIERIVGEQAVAEEQDDAVKAQDVEIDRNLAQIEKMLAGDQA